MQVKDYKNKNIKKKYLYFGTVIKIEYKYQIFIKVRLDYDFSIGKKIINKWDKYIVDR